MFFKRVLLKVSGESLMGNSSYGIDVDAVDRVAEDIRSAVALGYEVCLVVGGGNIFRGLSAQAQGLERATADQMGMLATIMNAVALQNVLEKMAITTRVQSAITMIEVAEPYVRRKALRHMEKGRVVIFSAGTGNAFFTTDTAAVLRAIEMNCDVLCKGTQVDGIYDRDPKKQKDAVFCPRLNFSQVIEGNLRVMDITAFTLARDNDIPVIVFNINQAGAFLQALKGEGKFSIVQ